MLEGQKKMFFEFLDMNIHKWEIKEEFDQFLKEKENEDWEAYKAANL